MSAAPQIAILDYGMGNRRSVEKAFAHVGATPVVTRDHERIRAADGVVVPGVGAFPRAMRNLRELGLDEVVRERAAAGVPVLGICLGMQLLFERSVEVEPATGLGLLAGEVTPLDAKGERVPHIGWNVVRFERATRLNAALPEAVAFYHVHSFVVRPTDPSDALGTAVYGERFVSAVARDNVFGVQFHPEKSSQFGLRLLASFSAACGGSDGALPDHEPSRATA
ncbi:imidazole glycerol phosphate synthase subunit HisH [Conexibacter sp. JD483]|uniref:imidazole glycerol phosphate synthase subunit HisH n=1 Tax=unclassified Conexibacter TaxID=2627773 RepID=UPI002716D421|nr:MULTISPECIES: imidazole glycerol phosphate synthase subunit HisH [unclassified Conexibacter]MDO8189228.1 imidazole glycerol phosphate synthase subunit HisH [Conexibacter sp. CPCC 205706]MDO8201145.1 imidazole glycerol phosphate synthase subunit HisH [Conexibacter sp. CPCC 205762]MDR9372066.1 imidazole glycerol phosphate synthase subunit HisH [Conexibacter sp. JD483]